VAPDPGVPTVPEVPEVPVPDPADPVAGVPTLSVDDVPGVPVELLDAEWVGDAEWLGDDDPVDVTFGLAELEDVVEGVGLVQSEAVAVTACSAEGLGFVEVLVGFGVGVGLLLTLALALVLGLLLLTLGLLLVLTVLVGLAEWLAGSLTLLDRFAVLVSAPASDEFDGAADDGEHDAITAGVLPPADWLGVTARPPPCAWPPPVPDGLGVVLCELSPADSKIWWRSGGTAASTTPTANTARPTASAGRSIASRQSPDRCGACRAWDGPESCPLRSDGAVRLVHSWCQRLRSPARKPEIAALRDWAAVA
jgi:hypothetical protein